MSTTSSKWICVSVSQAFVVNAKCIVHVVTKPLMLALGMVDKKFFTKLISSLSLLQRCQCYLFFVYSLVLRVFHLT